MVETPPDFCLRLSVLPLAAQVQLLFIIYSIFRKHSKNYLAKTIIMEYVHNDHVGCGLIPIKVTKTAKEKSITHLEIIEVFNW